MEENKEHQANQEVEAHKEQHHAHEQHSPHEHHKHAAEKAEHHAAKKSLGNSFYRQLYMILAIALVIFALYNILQISSLGSLYDKKIAESKEIARPPTIQLTVISAPCEGCYDINAVVTMLESTKANITSKKEISFSSKEAKQLIADYSIEKIPTVIITGETSKDKSLLYKLNEIGEERKGAYVFTKLEPPFIETSSGNVRGMVSLIHLTKKDCKDCFSLKPLIEQLSSSGIKFKSQEEIDIDDINGKTLLAKYNIKKVPTLVMNKEAEVYPSIAQIWSQVGSKEKDGSLVLRNVNPLYYDVNDKTVKGAVSVIFLKDNSCGKCYDPDNFHSPILKRMGISLKEKKTLDISDKEGKELIDKYKIEKIPTMLLKGDMKEYTVLTNVWPDVGTVEPDGAYAFRKVEIAGLPHKNIATGEIIEPSTTASAAN